MGSGPQTPCESICSLPPEELRERVTMIRGEIAPLVVRRRDLADGREWEFASDASTRAKLANLIELERRCCAGIELELRSSADDQRLILAATGPRASELFDRAGL